MTCKAVQNSSILDQIRHVPVKKELVLTKYQL